MIRKTKRQKKELSMMIKTFGETTDPNRLHNYKRIDIVKIDNERYVRRKRDKKLFYRGEWQHVQGARKVQG